MAVRAVIPYSPEMLDQLRSQFDIEMSRDEHGEIDDPAAATTYRPTGTACRSGSRSKARYRRVDEMEVIRDSIRE